MDSLGKPFLEVFGMAGKLGGEDDEVGDRIAVLREFDEHAAFVADLVVGEGGRCKGCDKFVVYRQWVGLYIVDYGLAKMLSVGGELFS